MIPTRPHIAIVLQQRNCGYEHGVIGTTNRRVIAPMIHTQLGVLKECSCFTEMFGDWHRAFLLPAGILTLMALPPAPDPLHLLVECPSVKQRRRRGHDSTALLRLTPVDLPGLGFNNHTIILTGAVYRDK